MATFRDFALDADKHLVAAIARIGVISQADAALAAGELAALSRICGRVLDDVLDGYSEHTTEDARWRTAAHAARSRVRSAEQQLERTATAYAPRNGNSLKRVPGPSVALRTAIRRLGLAEEILQAELTPGAPGHRRPKLTDRLGLGDPVTAREITGLTGRWIGLVGEVADGLAGQIQVPHRPQRAGVEPMPQLLRQVGGCTRHARAVINKATGPSTQLSERLALLPRVRIGSQERHDVAAGPVQRLLGRADEQATALRTALNTREPGQDRPPISARSLRYIATSAGSVHTAAAIIARQLAARVAELHGSTGAPEHRALIKAADALIESGRAWHTAARSWDHVSTRDTDLGDAAAHATGTVMRLGQAAFADPDWTPASRDTAVRPATEFASDIDGIRGAAVHLNGVVSAFTGAARASGQAIGTLHDREALFTELGKTPIRAPHDHVADLRDAYDAVLHRAVTAERWLQTAFAPTKRDPAAAPALAATEFPDRPADWPSLTAVASASAPPVVHARAARRTQ